MDQGLEVFSTFFDERYVSIKNKMKPIVKILLKVSVFFPFLTQNSSDRYKKKNQKIEKVKLISSISLKNHYERIVATVKNKKIINQEEKNKIFVMY